MSTEESPPQDSIRAEPPTSPPPEPTRAVSTELSQDDKMWGMFCHLSALLGLMVGGFTFVGPLIC